MKIGVLALQGDYEEHLVVLQRLGVDSKEVRLADDLDELAALIIPGGESTTIGKLATTYGLIEPLRDFGKKHPIWGTCAGAIFLSRDANRDQPLLELMDIKVSRNAFGPQVESFEIDLVIPALEPPEIPYHAIFIRAPLIDEIGKNVEALARIPDLEDHGGKIVAAQEGNFLATSFHPELTKDVRLHRYFLDLTRAQI
jgi:5'-phosphate synthase pdxT subunit